MCDSKKRIAPIVHQQKNILTDFMQSHEELVSCKFSATFTKQSAQKLWEEVTNLLNAVPGGSKKNWNQWRKTWQDIKKNTKARAVADKRYETGTGGGPVMTSKIDSTDTKVLDLISPKATFGDLIPVPNVIFDFGNDLELQFDQNMSGNPSTLKKEEKIVAAKPLNEPDELQAEDCNNENKLVKNNKEPTATVLRSENMNNSIGTPKNTNKFLQRNRLTKTKTLQISTSISNNLVQIEEQKKAAAVAYYDEKIKYMTWRKTYEKRKLLSLQKQNKLNLEIIKELQNIKEAIRHSTYVNL